MSAETLYDSSSWHGSDAWGNGRWVQAAYEAVTTSPAHPDGIVVPVDGRADLYVAALRVVAGPSPGSAWLEAHDSVSGNWTHPTGTGRNADDWDDESPRNGTWEPQLWWEHETDPGRIELWIPPEKDQIRLRWVGVGNVEVGLWFRNRTFVYPPPVDPGGGGGSTGDCPPRPGWPYQGASITAAVGPRGVLRGARSRR